MASLALVEVRSYRPNITILGHQTAGGVDGDQDNDLILPSSIALCEVIELAVLAEVIDVVNTTILSQSVHGVWASIKSIGSASPEKDFVGNARWVAHATSTGVGRLSAVIKPDSPILWSPDYSLRVAYREVDTDATPLAVVTYIVRVQRVEPELGIGMGF